MNSEIRANRDEPMPFDLTALEFLRPVHVALIDEALAAVGDFGEVHLIVENHRLRFVITQRSTDVLKWQPGSLAGRHGRPG